MIQTIHNELKRSHGNGFFDTWRVLIILLVVFAMLPVSASAGTVLPNPGQVPMIFPESQNPDISTVFKDLPPESATNLTKNIADSFHGFSFDAETGIWSAWNDGEQTGILTTDDGGILLKNTKGSSEIHMAGLGRGDTVRLVERGTVDADGRRIEITRTGSAEWYLNKDDSIEQGMTITTRPAGEGILWVSFDLSGDLIPTLDRLGNLVFSDKNGPVLRYGSLQATDAKGRDLPAIMSLAGSRLSWEIDDRDTVYPVRIDPTITEVKVLSASDKADYNNFGSSVAISGDIAVVGALGAASGGTGRGQAYVFSKDLGGTNNWGQVKILSASDKADGDQFGDRVAISGDTVVVGAPSAHSGGTGRGQAYVFSKDLGGTNNWGQVKVLSASDKADFNKFGWSVAISGDTAVIGAPYAASNGYQRGQAYVFSKDLGGTNNWGQKKILSASDKVNDDYFGYSVAVSGNTTIVGARSVASGGYQRGQAYVFSKDRGGTNNWGQVKILSASDKADSNNFGYSVTVSGDTAVIGAPYAASGGTGRGQAYVFSKDLGGTNNWGQVKILSASDKVNGDFFGNSVAISGNAAVIGAYLANSSGTDRGQAYVLSKDLGGTNNWGQVKILSASDKADGDQFGDSVAISGHSVVIGAPHRGTYRGQAYVFKLTMPDQIGVVRNNKTWLLDASGNGAYGAGDLTYTFGITDDRYVTGDWNGNGTTEIGVVRNNKTWILDASGNGAYGAGDLIYTFGMAGDVPVKGDWIGTGTTRIGVVRNNKTWILDASGNGAYGAGDFTYTFGKAGDVYVSGDWTGTGTTRIGVVRDNKTWLLDASGDGKFGAGDLTYTFGAAGDRYVTGDWTGNGTTRIGVVRSNTTWLLDASGDGKWGPGDYQYTFGKAGDKYVTGKWN